MKSFYKYPIPRPNGYENLIEVPNIKTSWYVQKSIPDQDDRIPGSSILTPTRLPPPSPGPTPWVKNLG